LDYAHLAVDLFRKLEDDRSLGLALNSLAHAHLARGDYEKTQQALEEFQMLCEHVGGNEDRVRLKLSWGRFYRLRASSLKNDSRQARQKLEAALRLAAESGLDSWQTRVQEELDALQRGEAYGNPPCV
jgi:hypothetical protein